MKSETEQAEQLRMLCDNAQRCSFFMWFVALHFTQRLAMLNMIYYKHTGITYVLL